MTGLAVRTRIKNRAAHLLRVIAEAERELGELRAAERAMAKLDADERKPVRLTLATEAHQWLRADGPMTVHALADALNRVRTMHVSSATLASILSRGKADGMFINEGGKWFAKNVEQEAQT